MNYKEQILKIVTFHWLEKLGGGWRQNTEIIMSAKQDEGSPKLPTVRNNCFVFLSWFDCEIRCCSVTVRPSVASTHRRCSY
jgi:hypothetical protein